MAGSTPATLSASKAVRNIMIGPLSSDEARPKIRHSGSISASCSLLASISSHCGAALLRAGVKVASGAGAAPARRCLSTGLHGLFWAH